MSDEIEVPLEDVQDKIAELHKERSGDAPEHRSPEGEGERRDWTRFVAVTTALLAVLAAIGALQSGLLVNEALLEKNAQIGGLTQASDQWNYYQAEGLKALIYKTTAQSLPPGSPAARNDLKQSARYRTKQAGIQKSAQQLVDQSKEADKSAGRYLGRHHVFAFSVSLCQIAIALSAIAALTRRKYIWYIGIGAGLVSLVLLLYGFLH